MHISSKLKMLFSGGCNATVWCSRGTHHRAARSHLRPGEERHAVRLTQNSPLEGGL